MSQTTIDFTVHQYEPQSTQAHLNENRDRFNKQCKLVYDYIINHASITQIDADGIGVKRLASRICDLKGNGIKIESEFTTIGETKIKKYWIR